MNILDKIVSVKKEEIARIKAKGLKEPEGLEANRKDFVKALTEGDSQVSIIAEVKKASPSKGLICKDFDPIKIAKDYQAGGASAISVLTDEKFFQGSLEYLKDVKVNTDLPVLRKDFIIDHVQVEEAHIFGADAILLICAILDKVLLQELIHHATELGLSCLVETHDQKEAEKALEAGAFLIGINNRNLKDFTVDLKTTVEVRKVIPRENPVVSESGIRDRKNIEFLMNHDVQAVLIGEHLVKAENRIEKLKELLGKS